jgi:phenylalanyl-tRNA synthetase beta chain
VLLGDSIVGRLFEAHPAQIAGRAAIVDLNLDEIFKKRAPLSGYRPIRRFPSSAFDLSFAIPRREPAAHIEAHLRDFAGPLLDTVEYLSEYVGPQVPEGMKNISYRLTVGAPDRTLSSEEINSVRAQVISRMHDLGFEMRI